MKLKLNNYTFKVPRPDGAKRCSAELVINFDKANVIVSRAFRGKGKATACHGLITVYVKSLPNES